MRYEFWVDGACDPNPGKMGAGVVGVCGGHYREWSVPLGDGTNQRAELLAVKEALKRVKNNREANVVIYADSAYAIGCLTNETWNPRANRDILMDLGEHIASLGSFEMKKVDAHTGVENNEKADALAKQAVEVQKSTE